MARSAGTPNEQQNDKDNDHGSSDQGEDLYPARRLRGAIRNCAADRSRLLEFVDHSDPISGRYGHPSLGDVMLTSSHAVWLVTVRILLSMPTAWKDNVETHKRELRDAILDTVGSLARIRSFASLTMSEIAAETGIGRATLYKYFSSVEAVLVGWHERQVAGHLQELMQAAHVEKGAPQRLRAVLTKYAEIAHEGQESELAGALHRQDHVIRAQRHVLQLVTDLIAESAASGEVRSDVSPDELAQFSIHAINAARTLPSKAAVRRLVSVTLGALMPR